MKGILGVNALDALLGKVPNGARILLESPPDVGGRALVLQASAQALRAGQPVVYVVTARAPAAVRRDLERLGVKDLANLQLVDAFSGQLGSAADHALPSTGHLPSLLNALDDLAKLHPDALLCIESISTFIEKDTDLFLEKGASLLERCGKFQATLALHVQWPGIPDASRVLKQFDGGLLFYGIEDKVVRNNAFRVNHLAWSKAPDMRPRLVSVHEDGSLRALVPKVVITGPPNAGKTTMVNNLTTGTAGTERSSTTVAMDKGRYEADGIETHLFGTPGESRFDPIINTLLEQAAAVVVVVDSADENSFDRAKELLERSQRRGLHTILCGNKQDAKGAKSPKELEAIFGVPAMPCTATDKDAALAVMNRILEALLMEAPP